MQAVRSVASGSKFYRLPPDKENTVVVLAVSCTKKKTSQKKKEITPKKPLGVICHTVHVSELTVLIKGIFNSEQEKNYYNRKFD